MSHSAMVHHTPFCKSLNRTLDARKPTRSCDSWQFQPSGRRVGRSEGQMRARASARAGFGAARALGAPAHAMLAHPKP
jgi:hypothetical protein